MTVKDPNMMSVGQAAKKAGVSRQSLQYYLMMGVVQATEVTASGRRLFDDDSIKRIKLVKQLNDSGYPLRDIRELFVEGRSALKGGSPSERKGL
jgi:MerR family transcriptional regulator, mercuric resistance operon regulatory protein